MVSSIISRLGSSPEEGVKAPCVVETTANITLSGVQTINTVSVVADDRVLVKDQTDAAENGIWIVTLNAWVRATDMNNRDDVSDGIMVVSSHTSVLYYISITGSFWDPDVTDIDFPPVTFTLASSVADLTVTNTFTSRGIDDNATAERININDSSISIGPGGAASQANLYNRTDDGLLVISGGTAHDSGANILLYGGTIGNTGDMSFRNDGNVWMRWDETAGDLAISTGVGLKTTALTIDSSQNATFEGDVTLQVGGTLYFDGGSNDYLSVTPDNTLVGLVGGGQWLSVSVGQGTSLFGQVTTGNLVAGGTLWLGEWGEDNYIYNRADDTSVTIYGGDDPVGGDEGGSISLFAQNHAVAAFQNGVNMASGANIFLRWREDNGSLIISTGVGVKTDALTIDSSQDLTLAADLLLSNANSPQITLTDTTTPVTGRWSSNNSNSIIGTATAHSFLLMSDDTIALTINSSQDATFAGQVTLLAGATGKPSLNIPEGVAPSSPTDGDIWLTSTDFLARVNGVSRSLVAGGTIINKTTDETVNNSATLQNDNDFSFSVSANSTYRAEVFLYVQSDSTADFKFDWSVPAGAVYFFSIMHGITSTGNVFNAGNIDGNPSGGDVVAGDDGAEAGFVHGFLTVVVAGTAGTAQLQWAQATAQVADTDVKAGSYMLWKQME